MMSLFKKLNLFNVISVPQIVFLKVIAEAVLKKVMLKLTNQMESIQTWERYLVFNNLFPVKLSIFAYWWIIISRYSKYTSMFHLVAISHLVGLLSI